MAAHDNVLNINYLHIFNPICNSPMESARSKAQMLKGDICHFDRNIGSFKPKGSLLLKNVPNINYLHIFNPIAILKVREARLNC